MPRTACILTAIALLAASTAGTTARERRAPPPRIDSDTIVTGSVLPTIDVASDAAPRDEFRWSAPSAFIARACTGIACLRQFGSIGAGY